MAPPSLGCSACLICGRRIKAATFPVLTCVLAALVTWLVCYWMGADGSLTLLVLVLVLIVEIPCERLLYRINEVRERLQRVEEVLERMSKMPPP